MILYRYRGVFAIQAFGYRATIKTPASIPLFSERYGYQKPALALFGYRLFCGKVRKVKNGGVA